MRERKSEVSLRQVNGVLETMGFNIGTRIVDEFMARSGAGRCHSFEETAEVLGRGAFKMFLGTAATVPAAGWSADKTSFALVLEDNPLAQFVELPDELRKLKVRMGIVVFRGVCVLTRLCRSIRICCAA